MSLLRNIEERIGRLVGRAFRTSVQPVELARRLVTEMDGSRQRSVRGVFVANVYDIYLSEQDRANFEGHERSLTNELSEYVAEHARKRGYTLVTRPRVSLLVDPDLAHGAFGISSTIDETARDAMADAAGAAAVVPETTIVQPAVVTPEAVVPVQASTLMLLTPHGSHALSGRLTLGRGRSNDIVLQDDSVSREHAEIVAAAGAPVIRDLDSTNGVLVNGARVREQALAPGDRVLLGKVELRVQSDEDAS